MPGPHRPPGPADWTLGIRLARQIVSDLLDFYTNIQRQYGDIVYMRLGPYQDYSLFHPDLIREVLVEKAREFIRFEWPIGVLAQWNGEGLLISEGETWLRHRRILQPAFHRGRFYRYAEEITTATSKLLNRLENEQAAVDFEQAMTDLTTAVICRAMFGSDLGDERAQVRRAVGVLSRLAVHEMSTPVRLPDWLPLAGKQEKRWAMQTLDDTVRRFIRARRAAGTDQGDLLSMLLLAVDEEGDKRGLTDEQARDHCVTIFLAGHDTTAAGLIWVGWALASHPEIARRAAAEVDRVLGNRSPKFEDLPQLPLVECVVKETLRRWPPAPAVFPRRALHDMEIGGYPIPKGAIIRVWSYVVHHDPRWFPDPERFDPDRFAPGKAEQIPAGAYIPFGMGPRTCIGNNFAMTEMTLVTAMLLQRFEIAPADSQREPALEVAMSLRPRGGMRLRLTPRKAAVPVRQGRLASH